MTSALAIRDPRVGVSDWRAIQPANVEGYPPPHDDEAEALVIQAVFVLAGFLERVTPPLSSEHFFFPKRQLIFDAAVADHAETGAITPAGVIARLEADGHRLKTDDVREFRVLQLLTNQAARGGLTASEVEQAIQAANRVHQLAQQRALALFCQQTLGKIYVGGIPSNRTFFGEFEAKAADLSREAMRGMATVDGLTAVNEAVKEAGRRDGDVGVSSGLAAYDREVGLLRGGELHLVGGVSGDGKTAYGLTIAGNVALRGGAVHYVSIDMKPAELMLRLACSLATVSARRARDRQLDGEEWERLLKARDLIERKTEIHIDHARSMTVQDIDAQVRRTKLTVERAGKRLRLLVVDYVQQIGFLGASSRLREDQVIVAVSESLKTLATKHDVHVLGLVQMWPTQQVKAGDGKKKAGTPTGDGKPDVESIQGGRKVVNAAEVVGLIHRKRVDGAYPPRGPAELVMRKVRWGAKGSVPLIFDGPLTRFEDDKEAERRDHYGDRDQ